MGDPHNFSAHPKGDFCRKVLRRHDSAQPYYVQPQLDHGGLTAMHTFYRKVRPQSSGTRKGASWPTSLR